MALTPKAHWGHMCKSVSGKTHPTKNSNSFKGHGKPIQAYTIYLKQTILSVSISNKVYIYLL